IILSEQPHTLLNESHKLISLEITTNPGYNFVGSMMRSQGGAAVSDAISQTVCETYTSTLMDTLTEVETSTEEIQSALAELESGASELASSNENLQNGLDQAAPALGPAGSQIGRAHV